MFDLSRLKELGYDVFYSHYLPGLNPTGKKNVNVRCCFHEDRTPSLSLDFVDGLYNCYGCGAKGNVVQFIEQLYNLEYKEAVKKIEADFGLNGDLTKKSSEQSVKKAKITDQSIDILHKQLANEFRLTEIYYRYGLNEETVKKYRLGYQNDKYVIPLPFEDGYTLKEHKGLQTKGSKAMLYPVSVLEDKTHSFVVVTEGEFKALLLNQHGIPAVCGTAGAGTWKGEWSVMLAGRSVFLAYDNDEAGTEGARKAAVSLLPHVRSVKVVSWPDDMTGGYKDVTDYFVGLGHTADDFKRLLDQALPYSVLKTQYGIEFEDPDGYIVRTLVVVKVRSYKDKTVEDVCLYSPVLVRSRAVDIDTGNEELEIVYERDNVLRSLYVPRSELYSTRELIKLSDLGINVTSNNAKGVIDYLLGYENKNLGRIEKKDITRSLGWKSVNGKDSFVLGAGGSIEFKAESGFQRYAGAVSEKGRYADWLSVVFSVLQYPYASLAFYASFAAPLLKLVRAPNFVLDFYGRSSVGKTTVLEFAASVWGNPDRDSGLVFAWDSTKVFLERVATHFCDFPIFPDDSQTTNDALLSAMLYQVASGQGKGRGNVRGIRETDNWRTVCFSTGERPLTECSGYQGIQARVIEIYGKPFGDAGADIVNRLKRTLRANYGFAGKLYIQRLEAMANDTNTLAKLRKKYEAYQTAVVSHAGTDPVHPLADRYAHYFAVILLAMEIVTEELEIGDFDYGSEMIYDVYRELTLRQEDFDIGKSAMSNIISWVYGNESCFSETDTGREKYGRIVEGDYIAVFPRKLEAILKEDGYSPDVILNLWCDTEHDYLKRNDRNRTISVRIRELDFQKVVRMYAIKWEVVEEMGHEE